MKFPTGESINELKLLHICSIGNDTDMLVGIGRYYDPHDGSFFLVWGPEGTTNPHSYRICPYCGKELPRRAKLDQMIIATDTEGS